jgi:hypothetical protein
MAARYKSWIRANGRKPAGPCLKYKKSIQITRIPAGFSSASKRNSLPRKRPGRKGQNFQA